MATDFRLLDAGPRRSFGSLLLGVGSSVDRLVRAELRMAVAEARGELGALGAPTIMLGVGALVATLAAGFLLLGAAVALTAVMPPWAAALVVGGAVALVAVVLLARATSRLSLVGATRDHDAAETES